MNTEEVVAMIDAITEGGYYAHAFETKQDTITIEVGGATSVDDNAADGEFWFSSFTPGANFLAKIDDPRTAREIAGALVAWANRKEGFTEGKARRESFDLLLSDESHRVFTGKVTERQLTVYGQLNDGKKKVGNSSRADWYRRNVENMSQETKDRNLKDLRVIGAAATTHAERVDIWEAVRILLDNGANDV